MAGLVPAIHDFLVSMYPESKTWMPGTSPGTTELFERHALQTSQPNTQARGEAVRDRAVLRGDAGVIPDAPTDRRRDVALHGGADRHRMTVEARHRDSLRCHRTQHAGKAHIEQLRVRAEHVIVGDAQRGRELVDRG